MVGLTKVTLPPAFGSAYVGETFSCTLCANNEIPEDDPYRVITSVRVLAEMQTPSQVTSLELRPAEETSPSIEGLEKGQSMQKIVQFDLKEEGNHILAVSVSYTETTMSDHSDTHRSTPASGRVRTFRKLYQFIAQPCLSVRTKASELAPLEVENKALGPYGKSKLLRFALEAQLENVGDDSVVVEVRYSLPFFSMLPLHDFLGKLFVGIIQKITNVKEIEDLQGIELMLYSSTCYFCHEANNSQPEATIPRQIT